MDRNELNARLPQVVEAVVHSVVEEPRTQHLNRVYLPSRDEIIRAIDLMQQILFPGYFGKQGLTRQSLPFHIGEIVIQLTDLLYEQIRCCLRYRQQIPENNGAAEHCVECDTEAARIVSLFIDRIPLIRQMLADDVQAAFDGDPAAQSTDECVFSYPGLFAITVQRLAHEFYKLDVPMLPRIMTEHAHGRTGIDIHPGAQLGRSFFIDHGTGVVIGETTRIGEHVKLYQGVTLGALAPAYGQLLRGQKRHPTIEDNVTIYSHATILGGDTIIGRGAVINGNVFITASVPPFTQVSAEAPKLKYRQRPPRNKSGEVPLDFAI